MNVHTHAPTLTRVLVTTALCSMALSAAVVAQSFELIYEEPAPEAEDVAELVTSSGVFDEIVEDLEAIFDLPNPIVIRFTSIDEGPYYEEGEVVMPYEWMVEMDELMAANDYRETREEQDEALLQLVEFALYHEVGHALIELLDLPVLGKEEEAVDHFAAVLAAHFDLDDIALVGAGVYEMEAGQLGAIEEDDFWDEHALDEQRMFTIFCLVYGSNPEKHHELPALVGMPAEREPECERDYEQAASSWSRLLGAYLAN